MADSNTTPAPQAPGIFAAPSGPALRLDQAAVVSGVSGSEVSGKALINQRWLMIIVICLLFFLLNGVVCYLINKTINLEFELIAAGKAVSEPRIITNGVFMSLIGATVVQTGLVIRGITGFLFKDDTPAS